MIYIINKDKTKITPAINKIEIVKDGALWAIICGQERIAYYLKRNDAVKDMQKNVKKLERGMSSISFEGYELPKINCENCPKCVEHKGQLQCKLKGKVKTKCYYLFSPEKLVGSVIEEKQTNLENTANPSEYKSIAENNEFVNEEVIEQNSEIENENLKDTSNKEYGHKNNHKHKSKKLKRNKYEQEKHEENTLKEVVEQEANTFEEVAEQEEKTLEEVTEQEENAFEEVAEQEVNTFEEVVEQEENAFEEVAEQPECTFEEVLEQEMEQKEQTFEELAASFNFRNDQFFNNDGGNNNEEN